jgi:multiple sugar transport system permease protein
VTDLKGESVDEVIDQDRLTVKGPNRANRQSLMKRAGKGASALVWLTPAGVILGIFFIAPMVYAIYLAFTNLELLGPTAQHFSFTGTANFLRMIHDPVFWYSLKLTLIFVVLSGVVAQTVLGLALALLAQRAHFVVKTSVGAIVVLAWVVPEIAAAFMWFAFAQAHGILSDVIGRPSDDLLAYSAMVVVCVANAWRGTAFSMLILSAGLRNVPVEVEEAAQLEGASYWRRLTRITLPMIRPTIMTNMILVTLGTLSDFTLVYAMTGGGPGNATSILPVYMYIQGFTFNQLGYATMLALVLVLLGALLSVFYIRQLRPELRKVRAS